MATATTTRKSHSKPFSLSETNWENIHHFIVVQPPCCYATSTSPLPHHPYLLHLIRRELSWLIATITAGDTRFLTRRNARLGHSAGGCGCVYNFSRGVLTQNHLDLLPQTSRLEIPRARDELFESRGICQYHIHTHNKMHTQRADIPTQTHQCRINALDGNCVWKIRHIDTLAPLRARIARMVHPPIHRNRFVICLRITCQKLVFEHFLNSALCSTCARVRRARTPTARGWAISFVRVRVRVKSGRRPSGRITAFGFFVMRQSRQFISGTQ